MRILLDGRVLGHEHFSGVENYTQNLLKQFGDGVDVAKPPSGKRNCRQIWEHTYLPWRSRHYDLLCCPANIAPFHVPENTKLVLTLHDAAFKTFPQSFSRTFRRYYEWLVPRNIARADRVVTVSHASEKEILRFFPEAEGKITVIPPGVSSFYRPVTGVKKEKQLLCVGSVNERKNVAGVIGAFLSLPKGHGYRLVLAGNHFGNFALSERTLSALSAAKAHPDIVFVEGADDETLRHLYNASRCLVFPSFYEGFGLPPLEAMACGIPAIVSDVSAVPEACGEAALYCNPHDVSDIAEKMRRMMEDEALYAGLKRKGLEHVRKFSWEMAAKAHWKVFEEVCASRKR